MLKLAFKMPKRRVLNAKLLFNIYEMDPRSVREKERKIDDEAEI